MHIAPYLGEFLKQYPGLNVEIIATDNILDIVREGIDVAIRIAELDGIQAWSREARTLPEAFLRVACLSKGGGEPKTLGDLSAHKILCENNTTWRVHGPEGGTSLKALGRHQNE